MQRDLTGAGVSWQGWEPADAAPECSTQPLALLPEGFPGFSELGLAGLHPPHCLHIPPVPHISCSSSSSFPASALLSWRAGCEEGSQRRVSRGSSPRFWGLAWGGGLGAESCRGGLVSVPWVAGSHLCLKLQVMSHLGRLEIVFLSNVPKEIRSTEMAEIPSEPGAEQATEQGVGRGKSCSVPSRVEGRAGVLGLAPPQTPPG